MKSNKIFLGIITARGGSKGIPRKNIKKLAGKPLIEYTFDAVKGSKLLDRCIVSSEDEEIIKFSLSKNIEVPFIRPKELAKDDTPSIDVLIHALNYLKKKENYIPDYVVTLQPTSPLRTSKDIDNSIRLILEDEQADSLVSGVEVPHRFNPYSLMQFKGKYLEHYIKEIRIYRRQEKPKFYARNGAAIYITKYKTLIEERKIIGNKCLPYFMPRERSIDIDDMFDWRVAECFLKNNWSIKLK
ncbi:MAG: acylneuraminate cytidylyltransferase family protein [Promethearchaeota archaeon]